MRTLLRPLYAAAFAGGLLAGCGGGTDGTGGMAPLPTAQSVVIGVMTKGSVIVNGVHFDDRNATIRVDDRSGTSGELADGMFVKVLGRINSDKVTGVADRIEVENELRGVVQTVDLNSNPPSFTVAGVKVYVDGSTVFGSQLSGIGALAAGITRVEVHGLRDPAGNVRASRVDAASSALDELKGTVSGLDPATRRFVLGNVTVDFSSATVSPAGAVLANGVPVEVHGSFNAATGVFFATVVDREDLEDDAFKPDEGGKLEIEGFVSGFVAHPGTFQVETRRVQTTSSTRFEGGTAADLGSGVKVQAGGSLDAAGVLVADKIEFEDASGGSSSSGIIRLTGTASAVDIGARTLTMFGKTIRINDLTELGTPLAAITVGVTRLEVRASLDANGSVAAEHVESTGESRDEVQARVTAKDDAAFTLTLLDSIDVALGGSAVQFRGSDDSTITRAAFFAAITPASATNPGTLVDIRGSFNGTTLTAERAELDH